MILRLFKIDILPVPLPKPREKSIRSILNYIEYRPYGFTTSAWESNMELSKESRERFGRAYLTGRRLGKLGFAGNRINDLPDSYRDAILVFLEDA